VNITQALRTLFVIGIGIYVAISVFKEMIVSLWTISPLTCIGFVVSVAIAIWNGRIGRDVVKSLKILGFIFAGTIISQVATSQLQNLWHNFIAGNLVGAGIIGAVILVLYLKGREIQNTNP
jgi:uncharacterized protein (DUF2062 family)